jgi:hypothetical protein
LTNHVIGGVTGSPPGGDKTKYCRLCLRKNPPVKTPLILGVNLSNYNHKVKNWMCNPCQSTQQKTYRSEEHGQYKEKMHLEAIEILTKAWNDPVYKNIKEIKDKVVKVWKKNGWNTAELGHHRDHICEVLFPDMWNVDPNDVVENYFNKHPEISKAKKFAIKAHILAFVVDNIELITMIWREKARNKWNAIVDAIAKAYHDREKMVAQPEYYDQVLKVNIPRYHLLSKEDERRIREEKRDARIEHLKTVTELEKILIQKHEEEERKLEKTKQQRSSSSDAATSDKKKGEDNNKEEPGGDI